MVNYAVVVWGLFAHKLKQVVTRYWQLFYDAKHISKAEIKPHYLR